MRRNAAFTLLEIILVVFILLLITLVAVPSIDGLMHDRNRRQSFEKFDDLVQTARSRSITEQRTYRLVWEQKMAGGFSRTVISLRPEDQRADDAAGGAMQIESAENETYDIELPAALEPVAEKAWAFWPSGTCEPANIFHKTKSGGWSAVYDPLTAQGKLTME